MAEDVANIEVWKRLVAILKPNYGEVEFLEDAAKRCAAMAAKLPRAQKKAMRWKKIAEYWRKEYRTKEVLYRLDHNDFMPAWHRCERREKQANRLLAQWAKKADKIAAALGIRDGETLAQAAERVARESKEWERLADYWERQVKKLEDAEAETARLKKALEDQAQATEQGRELVGPWIVERDEWRRRAQQIDADFRRPILARLGISDALSFQGAAEQVIARCNLQIPAHLPKERAPEDREDDDEEDSNYSWAKYACAILADFVYPILSESGVKSTQCFRDAAAMVVEKLKAAELHPVNCRMTCSRCGRDLIDVTDKSDKGQRTICMTCDRPAEALQEHVSQFAKWSGMSTAHVEPHPEPPQEKLWE